jgi:hypothetical protein
MYERRLSDRLAEPVRFSQNLAIVLRSFDTMPPKHPQTIEARHEAEAVIAEKLADAANDATASR